MNSITKETRIESYLQVDKEVRQQQIKSILASHPQGMTAKEVAIELYNHKLVPSAERNYSAPRLTELERMSVVEVIGKKKCDYSNKTVAVYKLI